MILEGQLVIPILLQMSKVVRQTLDAHDRLIGPRLYLFG